jgi:hypothetical protein
MKTNEYTSEMNGHEFSLKKTSPARLQKLDALSKELAEWNEENEGFYLYDVEFRAQFMKKLADIIVDFKGNGPDEDLWESDELEVSELVSARSVFFARAGLMS